MSVLAVVSKAIFEKEARVAGKVVGPGDVWPTALYASNNPGLSHLTSGGALYLVTVRPGDVLWLVAVLEAPKHGTAGWTAAPNTTPVRDISALVSRLRFASGKGVTAEPGKLGMSLQTPRVLTDADVALLGGGGSSSTSSASTSASPPLAWRLDGYRRRKTWGKLTAIEKQLLERFEGEIETAEEFGGAELVDVVDSATGSAIHLLAVWPFGDGVLVELATKEPIADICQHGFDAHGDDLVRTRLAAAYAEARKRLGDLEGVDFRPGQDTPKRKEPTPASDATLAEIRAMRAGLEDGTLAIRDADGQRRLWELGSQVFDFKTYRPLPVRRLFELTEMEREMLELIWEGNENHGDLYSVGLPDTVGAHWRRSNPSLDVGDLARYLGHVPPGPLDETIDVDGQPHPVWCLLHDAMHGVREVEAVVALLLALPTVRALAIARAFIADTTPRMVRATPTEKDYRRGLPTLAANKQHRLRKQQLAAEFFKGLGAEGEAGARASVAQRAGFADLNRDVLTNNPHFIHASGWSELCLAFGVLARGAVERGSVLEPEHDETLRVIALANVAKDALIPVLDLLPLERAGRIACGQLDLIARYPTADGAAAAMNVFQTRLDGGDYSTKLFAKTVAALGELARPGLLALRTSPGADWVQVPRGPTKAELIDRCLIALDKAAAKPAKKTAAKKPK